MHHHRLISTIMLFSLWRSSCRADSRHQMRCRSSSELSRTVIAAKVIMLVIRPLFRKTINLADLHSQDLYQKESMRTNR